MPHGLLKIGPSPPAADADEEFLAAALPIASGAFEQQSWHTGIAEEGGREEEEAERRGGGREEAGEGREGGLMSSESVPRKHGVRVPREAVRLGTRYFTLHKV